jgi:aldehyde dehydrogenase (NAD+)
VSLNTKRILDFGSPFGGLRHSGLGRELGPEGIDAYLESKSVILPAGVGTNRSDESFGLPGKI